MNDNLKEISHCTLSWIRVQRSNGRKINASDEKKTKYHSNTLYRRITNMSVLSALN
jgi:hypothetical protein